MTETPVQEKPSFDFSEVTGQVVTRLKAKKVQPVDAAIVRQAQRSWDGVPLADNPEELGHNLVHTFATVEMAAEFARQMRNAGDHTNPLTSVSVVVNPDPQGKNGTPTDERTVSWRAGKRRGRETS